MKCLIACLIHIITHINGDNMEGYIIGGQLADIKKYPHAVFLFNDCGVAYEWICGATVLNQKILITAGHCAQDCAFRYSQPENTMMAYLGHEDMSKARVIRKVISMVRHKAFDEDSLSNDIALLIVRKSIPLNSYVKRAIISPTFPRLAYEGYVAAWTLTEGNSTNATLYILKQVYQKLRSIDTCKKYGSLPVGTFCATGQGGSQPNVGDSGSALMTVNGFQQIGIVSGGCVPPSIIDVVYYVNITLYFDWIVTNAQNLYCVHNSQ